ncbi:MAG: diphthine--ammonia ligase [Methanosarcinales archaeon]
MKLAALISGGKDSSYALYQALKNGYKIIYLIAIKPQRDDSYMYHSANIDLTELFAEACGIPLILKTSSGEKEKELKDLEEVLSKMLSKIDGVVVGAIESEYQASRIKKICQNLNLEMYAPLWHKDPESLLKAQIKVMDIRIVQVAAYGFDEGWLGRKIDLDTLKELKKLNKKYKVHIAGEGGEYETLVVDAIFFKKRIELIKVKKSWDMRNIRGTLKVLEAKLVDI